MANRVQHFEIQADDVQRAASFYTEVFDWKITKWEGDIDWEYWMITTSEEGYGINGGLLKRPAKTPPQECGTNSYVCTIDVDDFDAIATKITDAGGIVALPKFAMKGLAWQGYFLDTEGNTFGVYQADPAAK